MQWFVDAWNALTTGIPLAGVFIGALLAYKQLKQSALDSKVSIAKNHYRDTLNLFLQHTDIVYLGTNAASYEKLTTDTKAFRRYRWLFTIVMFSLQELHQVFVDGPMKDKKWERTILIIASVFKEHFNSQQNFPAYIRSGYNSAFLEFVADGIASMQHPAANMALSRVLQDKQK